MCVLEMEKSGKIAGHAKMVGKIPAYNIQRSVQHMITFFYCKDNIFSDFSNIKISYSLFRNSLRYNIKTSQLVFY